MTTLLHKPWFDLQGHCKIFENCKPGCDPAKLIGNDFVNKKKSIFQQVKGLNIKKLHKVYVKSWLLKSFFLYFFQVKGWTYVNHIQVLSIYHQYSSIIDKMQYLAYIPKDFAQYLW